jgi:hypothetical protein
MAWALMPLSHTSTRAPCGTRYSIGTPASRGGDPKLTASRNFGMIAWCNASILSMVMWVISWRSARFTVAYSPWKARDGRAAPPPSELVDW